MDSIPNVDAYIEQAPARSRPLLLTLRRLVLAAAPGAVERIRYGMPAYELAGRRFAHFSAASSHLGVYGLVHEDHGVPPELAAHFDHRSTLRFRYDEPLPEAALAAALRGKAATFKG